MHKLVPTKDLVEGGYLLEVNRQFFHPMGMVLQLIEANDGKLTGELRILDYRDSNEETKFDFNIETESYYFAHYAAFRKILKERKKIRKERLGYWVQTFGMMVK